jgi:hypothetical protein
MNQEAKATEESSSVDFATRFAFPAQFVDNAWTARIRSNAFPRLVWREKFGNLAAHAR